MIVGDLKRKVSRLSHKSAAKLKEKSKIENMDLTHNQAHQTGHSGNGLLYRYGSKSRRKVIWLLVAVILMPLECKADDKIVRVDPLGKNIFPTEFAENYGEKMQAACNECSS